ncbi:hypothetical protein CONPUDRAFT_69795 [Coniophora puteana RWD-64-598 SS2]|uniref:Uncharacterized protein n=1 Tax=Coniophora puteana (strain RWD-64-598) TaxID=741705 RepID=A0A5M3N1L7_CONPW|nr:uncharacterized protein CONPUDRAFT_69795 [Coniophora puteana RWD-64-598 SS2]EIW84795.1 hypothetical protein CONPUDRAFT_69795 [Coniophora puteana RWD-64-598 SS2]
MPPPWENIPFGCDDYPTGEVLRTVELVYEYAGRPLPHPIDGFHNTPSLGYVPPEEGLSEPKAVVLNLREGIGDSQRVIFTVKPATMMITPKIEMQDFCVCKGIVDDVIEAQRFAYKWAADSVAAREAKEREEAQQRQAEHEAVMANLQANGHVPPNGFSKTG